VTERPPVSDPPSGQSDREADALFEEARRLRRRRCLIGSTLAAVGSIVFGALVAFWSGGSGSAGLQRIGRTGPLVNLSTMRHEVRLAFVSRNDLYLVGGPNGAVHQIAVERGRTALHPNFSRDGPWIVYERDDRTGSSTAAGPEVWIARPDGGDRHRIVGADGVFGWSPSADLLAISTDTRARFPGGSTGYVPTRIDLVSPTGAPRRLIALRGRNQASVAKGYRIWNAVWSPSGDALAVSLVSFTRGSIIRSYPVDRSRPTTWFAIDGRQALPGVCTGCGGGGTISDLAGWWPKWGIGFWVFSSGMVHNNDSTPIELVHAPRSIPHIIGQTLSDGTTVAASASRTGALAVVASTGSAGRDYGAGKEIETCELAHETCAPIPDATIWHDPNPLKCSIRCLPTPPPGKPGSAVTLDPAWSPTENLLAYVKAPTAFNGGNPAVAWYAAHELFVYNPAAHRSTRSPESTAPRSRPGPPTEGACSTSPATRSGSPRPPAGNQPRSPHRSSPQRMAPPPLRRDLLLRTDRLDRTVRLAIAVTAFRVAPEREARRAHMTNHHELIVSTIPPKAKRPRCRGLRK
jgi:hypothetical protein